jgi:hypothetical protein
MDPLPHPSRPRARRSSRIVAFLDEKAPFWEPQLVVAAAIVLDLALSRQVTLGQTWLLPAVEGALLLGLVIASPHPGVRNSPVRRRVAIGLIALVSAVNTISLVLLCRLLLNGHKENGHQLILSGIVLWVTNVLLFGLWYYELDRGGPVERIRGGLPFPDFLFPQMTDGAQYAPPNWRPQMTDYLYTSFTNATAFSPTDTMPLSPSAKWLMSAQAGASLVTVALVVARAVNILQG